MNLAFLVTAAETMEANARKAEASGNAAQAKQFYAIAAQKYRDAAKADPAHYAEYTDKAEKLEKSATAATATPAGGGRSSAPSRANSGRPASGNAHSESKRESENEEDKPKTFEGYDLDISMPKEKITFNDIIGLEKAKKKIYDELVYPMQHREEFLRYDLQPGGYMLLWGPPGTGKTTFAKAVASEISVPFVNVVCPTLVDKYIGETAKNIAALFSEVRRFTKEQHTPVVLFFDEFDAIAKKRGGDDKTADSAVPALLQELDGFDKDSTDIIIIGATNLMSDLDSAILSRLEGVFVPLPDVPALKQLYKLKISKYKLQESDLRQIDFDKLAQESEGLSGRDLAEHIIKPLRAHLAKRDSGLEAPRNLQELLIELIRARVYQVKQQNK